MRQKWALGFRLVAKSPEPKALSLNVTAGR
jgi:hypothetical protein